MLCVVLETKTLDKCALNEQKDIILT